MNRLTPLAAARIAPWRSGPRRQVADAVRRKPAPQMTWFAPLELKIVMGEEGKKGEGEFFDVQVVLLSALEDRLGQLW